MSLRIPLSIALGVYLALGIPAAAAADPAARLSAEVDAALLRLADRGELPAAEPLRIEQPPRTRRELGAVLDLAADGRGAAVLAVSPGGAAERLGLRRGDRVLVLNGVELRGNDDAELLHDALEAGEGGLVLRIERDGVEQELRGLADSTTLPGYQLLLAGVSESSSNCGRVNVLDVFPRSQDIFPVTVIAIDGRYPGDGPSFRLDPGLHRVTVAENIDSREFNALGLAVRNRSGRSGPPDLYRPASPQGPLDAQPDPAAGPAGGTRYKDLEIDVRPGITYRIAAQMLSDDSSMVRRFAFWRPILWKESAEVCR